MGRRVRDVTSSSPYTAGLPTTRHVVGLGTSGLHTDACWECHAPVTPILWGFGGIWVVLCRYPTRSLGGIPPMSAVGIPILSDCPGMRADIPPRSVCDMFPYDIKPTKRTRFTPGLTAGILSLKKIDTAVGVPTARPVGVRLPVSVLGGRFGCRTNLPRLRVDLDVASADGSHGAVERTDLLRDGAVEIEPVALPAGDCRDDAELE